MIKKTLIQLLIISILISIVFATTTNPSAEYCESMGYEFSIEKTDLGELGICNFPDGSSVSAWSFLKGKEGEEFSYCLKNGYELKTVNNSEKCATINSKECAVCLKDAEEIEVTELMGLNSKIIKYSESNVWESIEKNTSVYLQEKNTQIINPFSEALNVSNQEANSIYFIVIGILFLIILFLTAGIYLAYTRLLS